MLILNISFHFGIVTKLEKKTLKNKDFDYYIGYYYFNLKLKAISLKNFYCNLYGFIQQINKDAKSN